MKTRLQFSARECTAILACASLAVSLASAQVFDSGSNGSYGPITVVASQTLTLDMPTDGVFHCTTITVESGGSLRFNRNALNTPVYLLATGDVIIRGYIYVDGTNGPSSPASGGRGGPGGFDGGAPGVGATGSTGGAGLGPGAGLGGRNTLAGGNASHSGIGARDPGDMSPSGAAYGSQLLQPLLGGSGGGASAGIGTSGSGWGGGGGGGAIQIASSTRVSVVHPGGNQNGIFARAGWGNWDGGNRALSSGGGSGGAIRIVAPIVQTTQNALLDTSGGRGDDGLFASWGRVRIDTIDRSQLSVVDARGQTTVGSFMVSRIPDLPKLDVIEVADQAIPLGFPSPVYIPLPFGSPNMRSVTVRATGFNGTVPASVVLTPNNGDPIVVPFEITATDGEPVEQTIDVLIPSSAVTAVNVWTN